MEHEKRYHVAKEGMVFTDGTSFVTKLWLGDWDSLDRWPEITKEEADEMRRKQEQEELLDVEQSVAEGH